MSFIRTTIQGIEWELFYFFMLVFFAMERATHNTYAALFIAYIVDAIFLNVRAYFIKRNLARKTLIDDRFMI